MTDAHWLDQAVCEGLQILLTLRLAGAPAEDTIDAVAEVWVAAFRQGRHIGWEPADAARVRQAFIAAAATVDRWPPPTRVLDALLPRDHGQRPAIARDRAPLPPAIRAELHALLERLRMPDTVRHGRPPNEQDWPAIQARLDQQRALRAELAADAKRPTERP